MSSASVAPSRLDIYAAAVNTIAAAMNQNRPILYAANGQQIIPDAQYSYQRSAASRKGSMKNWVPKRVIDRTREASEREAIVERSVDLTNNDPHAAGIVDNFATTVVGSGLTPIPAIDNEYLGLNVDTIRTLQLRQRAIFNKWVPFSDAALRMSYGALCYLLECSLVTYGEYIVLYHMIDDPIRPYNLALQVINPQRLRTPTDKYADPTIHDGVELGSYGEPVAYWIKKSSILPGKMYLPDTSTNFARIPARTGHRWNIRHVFIARSPEQVRGWPAFGPGMKMLRDLNDYLDAELVSNIVTAAFALFIKTANGQDPFNIAESLGRITETSTDDSGRTKPTRYQEFLPGQILYGENGQEVQPIAANRPGATFDPFTKIVKKALALSINMPYTVAFKDLDGVNYAGFRSAMLDAWRVFTLHRSLMGQMICQPTFTMLIEEAYLRGEFEVKDFYLNMHAVTRCDWRGGPKGDIEPIKASQADALLIQNNLKTRAEAIAERGGDLRSTMDQLAEEQEMMRERGLTEEKVTGTLAERWTEEENETGDETTDDMQGAGNEGM